MALAIIAGRGGLPMALAASDPAAIIVKLQGIDISPPPDAEIITASFEKLGRLFSDLRKAQVTEIVMAGAMDRPDLNPARFDMKMMKLAPGLLKAFRQGDDGLLRKIIAIFEGEGFRIIGPADIAPDLVASVGVMAGNKPDKGLLEDADRARTILRALGGEDLGQAAVAAGRRCLGIETIQGTDALLDFVARTPAAQRPSGGVLVKWPKPGQDLRVDMPTIGPKTIQGAIDAGLKGILIAAGEVLVLERAAVIELAGSSGLSIWAEQGPL